MVQGLPHDIYSIQPYVRPLWLSVVYGLSIALLMGGLLGGLYWWYRRRKSYVPPPRIKDSWELLTEELELLKNRLDQEGAGETRELFYGLSLVLRRAIELATGIRATDLTVKEIRARLKVQTGIHPDLVKEVVSFLARSDLIKFADALAESGEAASSYKLVKGWVLDIKPRPQAPLPADGLTLKGQNPQRTKS